MLPFMPPETNGRCQRVQVRGSRNNAWATKVEGNGCSSSVPYDFLLGCVGEKMHELVKLWDLPSQFCGVCESLGQL